MLHQFRFALYAMVVVGILGCQKEAPTQPPRPAPEVDVAHPVAAVISEWDEYTGRFAAVNSVELRARVSGYVQEVKFAEGQAVSKDQVLFVIDQRPFKIAVEAAQSRFELAEKELKRGQDLRRKASISQEELDRRINEFTLAKSELDRALLDLQFTEVRSPIAGLAGREQVNVGNLVNTANATLLTTVVSIDPIHFYFDAGQREYLKYARLSQSNQRKSSRTAPNPVHIRLQDEAKFEHHGVMDFVDNQVNQSTGTIQGRAILENDDGLLLPGLFGRLRLLSRENVSVILVPDGAIGTDQASKFVYVLDKDNQVVQRPVTLGKLHTHDLRIIEAGLTVEDKVIVNGLLRARPGVTVNPEMVDIAALYPLSE